MRLLLTTLLISLALCGCATYPSANTVAFKKSAWWGTSSQIKHFLDTPEAQKVDTWYIESITMKR